MLVCDKYNFLLLPKKLVLNPKDGNKLVSLCYNVLNKSPFIDKMTYSAYYLSLGVEVKN